MRRLNDDSGLGIFRISPSVYKTGVECMKLYWVTTEDHDEDWFIIASSNEEAARLHEYLEGYEPGDATAERVLAIPNDIPAKPGWPTNSFLRSIGAVFISNEPTRVIEIAGRKFCEGMLESIIIEVTDDEFEKRGGKRLNNTKKPFYPS